MGEEAWVPVEGQNSCEMRLDVIICRAAYLSSMVCVLVTISP